MNMKKMLSTLLLCGCISLGSMGLVACNTSGDPMQDAYNAYKAATESAGKTPLSKEAWLEQIKKAPGDDKTGNEALDAAYSVYCETMTGANKTPLSKEEWLAYIKAETNTNTSTNTGSEALDAAYETYSATVTAAGKTPLSKNAWLADIKKEINAFTGNEALDAAYANYCETMTDAEETPLSKEEWKAYIEDITYDGMEGLETCYVVYCGAMTSAGKTALSYEEWLVEIMSATEIKTGNEALDKAYADYCTTMQVAEKTALSKTEWLAYIIAETNTNTSTNTGWEELDKAYATYCAAMESAGKDPLSKDAWLVYITDITNTNTGSEELDKAYNAYCTASGEKAISKDEWLAYIKAQTVYGYEEMDTAYDTYYQAMQSAGKIGLMYSDWKIYITSETVYGDTDMKNSYESYLLAMNESDKNPLSYTEWVEYIESETVEADDALEYIYNTVADTTESYETWAANFIIGLVYPDADLDSLYEEYSAAAGEVAASKEDWLVAVASAAKKGSTIDSDADGNTVITYADGSSEIVAPLTTITVYAVDNNGNAVADAWIAIGYYSSETYVTEEVVYGKTDANGMVKLAFAPQAGITYRVRVAYTISDEYNAIPKGYEPNYPLDPIWGDPQGYWDYLPENGAMTVSYNDISNNYYEATVYELNYNREMIHGDIYTYSSPLKLDINAGAYKYFWFEPYVNPETDEEDAGLVQDALNKAEAAAVGKYRITFESSSPVLVSWFNASAGYCSIDEDTGIPNDLLGMSGKYEDIDWDNVPYQLQAAYNNYVWNLWDGEPDDIQTWTQNNITFSGDNSYFELELNSEKIRGTYYFAVYSDSDNEVSISAERVGDARERVIETYMLKPSAPIVKYDAVPEGELTLMSITGSIDAVYNEEDGYYHVGKADGPILFVQLNNAIDRVSPESLQDIPNSQDKGVYVWQQHVNQHEYLTYVFDYYEMIMSYCLNTNEDGVYPVNEDIYNFLNFIKGNALCYPDAEDGYEWLAFCQYYAPEGGLELNGEGTYDNPYVLLDGVNTINLGAEDYQAYMTYSVTEDGWYKVNASMEISDAYYMDEYSYSTAVFTTIGENTYAYLDKYSSYLFAVYNYEGYEGAVTVELEPVTNELTSVFQSEVVGDEVVDTSVGTTVENGKVVMGKGLYEVIVNPDQGENGVFIKYQLAPGAEATRIAFHLYGSEEACAVAYTYNEEYQEYIAKEYAVASHDVLVLDAQPGQIYAISFNLGIEWWGANSGAFMLEITDAYEGEGVITTLGEDNDVEIELLAGKAQKFDFAENTDGTYKISATGIADGYYNVLINGSVDNSFTLSAYEPSFVLEGISSADYLVITNYNDANETVTLSLEAFAYPTLTIGDTANQVEIGELYVDHVYTITVEEDTWVKITTDEGMTVICDTTPIFDPWSPTPGEGVVKLSAGMHKIIFRHDEATGAYDVTIVETEAPAFKLGVAFDVNIPSMQDFPNCVTLDVDSSVEAGVYDITIPLPRPYATYTVSVWVASSETTYTLTAANNWTATITLEANDSIDVSWDNFFGSYATTATLSETTNEDTTIGGGEGGGEEGGDVEEQSALVEGTNTVNFVSCLSFPEYTTVASSLTAGTYSISVDPFVWMSAEITVWVASSETSYVLNADNNWTCDVTVANDDSIDFSWDQMDEYGLTVTVTAQEGGEEGGGEVIVSNTLAVGDNTVTITDNYGWFDEYTFTPNEDGTYVFTLPAGLGIWSQVAQNPELDYQMDSDGGEVSFDLIAGNTYTFTFGATTKEDFTVAIAKAGGEVVSSNLVVGTPYNVTLPSYQDNPNYATVAVDSSVEAGVYDITVPLPGPYATYTVSVWVYSTETTYTLTAANNWTATITLATNDSIDVSWDNFFGSFDTTVTLGAATGEDTTLGGGEGSGEEGGGEVIVSNTLAIGDNTVTITDNYCYVDEYVFTIEEAGTYTITLPSSVGAVVNNSEIAMYGGDGGSFVVNLNAGDNTIIFGSISKGDFVVSITEAEAQEPTTYTIEGLDATIYTDSLTANEAYNVYFGEAITAGEYSLTVNPPKNNSSLNIYVLVNGMRPVTTLSLDNNHTMTITLNDPATDFIQIVQADEFGAQNAVAITLTAIEVEEAGFGVGENTITVVETDAWSNQYTLVLEEAGWYNVTIPAELGLVFNNNMIVDYFGSTEAQTVILKLSAGENVFLFASATAGDYTVSIEVGEEPKLALNTTFDGVATTSMNPNTSPITLDESVVAGTYTITAMPAGAGGYRSQITLTVGDNSYTLDQTNNFTAEIEIASGVSSITLTNNNMMDFNVTITLTAVEAQA